MATLILYVTKYGATHEIARRIAERMDGAVLHDLKKGDAPSLTGFDCVILGSPLYVGSIRKEIKGFIARNKDVLPQKKLGLFVSGLQPEEEQTVLRNNFPPALLEAAKAVRFLGGIFDPKKAGMMERLAMKAAAKITEYTNTIEDRQIEQFVDAIDS